MRARNLTILVAVAAGAASAAIALAGVPTLEGAAAGLLVLDTLAAAVSLLAALLVFGRFRRSSLLVDVILVWAFWTLALGTLLPAFIPSLIEASDEGVGRRLELAAGVLGSVAVLVAAFFHERSVGWHRSGRVLAVAAGLIAPSLAIAAVAVAGEDYGLTAGREWALLVSAAGFGVGALAFTMRGERDGDPLAAWLGAACVLASMSRLLLAMTTAPESGAMHPADIGRLGFAVFLMIGAVLEIRGYWLGVGVLEERRRIARELHDGMAQELACIVTETRRPDRADAITWYRIARAAERALDESRRAIHALTSPLDQPLDEALVSTAEDVAAREGAEIAFDVDEGVRVGGEVREALVRIVREAVANAARHGQAGVITVDLKVVRDGLHLKVTDDGRGFAVDAPVGSGRVGLRSMRERAAAVGATLSVDSVPGRGTCVEVALSSLK